jgi:hypothetical protein
MGSKAQVLGQTWKAHDQSAHLVPEGPMFSLETYTS